MRLAIRSCVAAALLATAVVPGTASAQNKLYVSQAGSAYTAGAYGGGYWNYMTGELNTAFGAGNISTFADLSNLSTLLSFDRLWVDQRLGGALTATEATNLAAFLATGKRAVIIGENLNWPTWNNSIAAVVGGSIAGGQCHWTSSATVFTHALTAGVNAVTDVCGSVATGGTSLFADNFATLWGTQLNTLTILDTNLMDDSYRYQDDNSQFATNTAQWLAGGNVVTATPEPASLVLFGSGLAALGIFVRRRRD